MKQENPLLSLFSVMKVINQARNGSGWQNTINSLRAIHIIKVIILRQKIYVFSSSFIGNY